MSMLGMLKNVLQTLHHMAYRNEFHMSTTYVGKVQLLGGALDGQEFDCKHGYTLPPVLTFPNPKIFRLKGTDFIYSQVIYERVAINDGRTYYLFIGWK